MSRTQNDDRSDVAEHPAQGGRTLHLLSIGKILADEKTKSPNHPVGKDHGKPRQGSNEGDPEAQSHGRRKLAAEREYLFECASIHRNFRRNPIPG